MDFCKTKLIRILVASIFQRNWSPKRVFREAKFFSGPGCASPPASISGYFVSDEPTRRFMYIDTIREMSQSWALFAKHMLLWFKCKRSEVISIKNDKARAIFVRSDENQMKTIWICRCRKWDIQKLSAFDHSLKIIEI